MNSEVVTSLLVKLLIAAGTGYATKYGIDGDTLNTIVGSLVALGSAGFGVYQHWGKIKVSQNATVIPPK